MGGRSVRALPVFPEMLSSWSIRRESYPSFPTVVASIARIPDPGKLTGEPLRFRLVPAILDEGAASAEEIGCAGPMTGGDSAKRGPHDPGRTQLVVRRAGERASGRLRLRATARRAAASGRGRSTRIGRSSSRLVFAAGA